MTDKNVKKKPWQKRESHLDKWAELLKDPKVRKEWEDLKKEKKDVKEKKKND
jgi:hypothetical protein